MRITFGELRGLLREASTVSTHATLLKSGDIVTYPESEATFAIHKITKPKRMKVKWIVLQVGDSVRVRDFPTSMISSISQNLDIGEFYTDGYVKELFDGVAVMINVYVHNGRNTSIEYAVGPNSEHINELLRQQYAQTHSLHWIKGHITFDVVGYDPAAAASAQRLVPNGLPFWKLVALAFADEPDKPLSEVEIRQRIARLKGTQYTDRKPSQLGYGPFSINGNGSLVASGLLVRHGKGSNVSFTLAPVDKVDWRPDETVPEDFYAL